MNISSRFFAIMVRPKRQWQFLQPHKCKYCQRFINNFQRYISHKNSHELSIRPYRYKNSQLPPKAGCVQIQRRSCHGNRNITLAGEDATKEEIETATDHELMDVTGQELYRGDESINQTLIWNHKNKKEMELASSSVNTNMPFQNSTSMNSKNTGDFRTEKRECEYCHKAFSSVHRRNLHQMNQKQNMSYQCEICNISFSIMCAMKAHYKMHLKNEDCKCKYCNKSFRTKQSRKLHEMTHTGEKPHQCSYCFKAFRTKGEKNNMK